MADSNGISLARWPPVKGIKKSNWLVASNNLLKSPVWYLGNQRLNIVDSLDILGVTFSPDIPQGIV